jgi:hypothetical protein
MDMFRDLPKFILLFAIFTSIFYRGFGQCTEEFVAKLRRTAFVAGNNNYQQEPLVNAVNDAVAMGKALRRLGFDPILDTNTNLVTLNNDIIKWMERVRNTDVAIFYFAGHGTQIRGINYLYPTDANFSTDRDEVMKSTFSANSLLNQMQTVNPNINILILDACRKDVTRAFNKSFTKNGLKNMKLLRGGTLIGYPVPEGQTTPDGHFDNSLYTQAILDNIELPNISIKKIFGKVQDEVERLSNNSQIPFVNTSIGDENDICLKYRINTGVKTDFFQSPGVAEETEAFRRTVQNDHSEIPEDTLTKIFNAIGSLLDTATKRICDSLGNGKYTVSVGTGPDYANSSYSYSYWLGDQHFPHSVLRPRITAKVTAHEVLFLISDSDDPDLKAFVTVNKIQANKPVELSRGDMDWNQITQSVMSYYFTRRKFLLGKN